ncbi:MAG: RHS repeat-associated core domain-containing protein [Kiritimatiellae bacterium]|nr:RHS repeat-associated core domain-containing protein [Kiritimatiellia bacterium]
MVSSFDYTNDALGRRTARSDYYINRGSTEANTFGYNTFSEVTNAKMGTNTYSYAYDPIGNRDQAAKNSVATDYEANGLNQYTNITGGLIGTPTFDLDGNMTFLPSTSGGGAGGWHCQWDAENRLIGVSNLTTTVVACYTYDHQSRRISKSTLTPSTPSSSLTSKFTYDGWNLIHEQTSTNNLSFIAHNLSFYTWGLDLSGTLQGAGGVGGLLCETKVTNSEINTYYALADANGNITEYLNDSGTVVAHSEYDAFGNTSASSGDMVDDFVFRFSSKYLDSETGLYYYGFRYYDPVTGRWLSRDPIEESGGINLYGIGGNDLINKIDLLGNKSTKCCGDTPYDPHLKCCCEKTKKLFDKSDQLQWHGMLIIASYGYFISTLTAHCELDSTVSDTCNRYHVSVTAQMGGVGTGGQRQL